MGYGLHRLENLTVLCGLYAVRHITYMCRVLLDAESNVGGWGGGRRQTNTIAQRPILIEGPT